MGGGGEKEWKGRGKNKQNFDITREKEKGKLVPKRKLKKSGGAEKVVKGLCKKKRKNPKRGGTCGWQAWLGMKAKRRLRKKKVVF